jgi:hypothetical protein
MTPGPAAGLLWAAIDIALCHFSVLHPIYYLVESTILMALNIVFGIMSTLFHRLITVILGRFMPNANTMHQLGRRWLLGA